MLKKLISKWQSPTPKFWRRIGNTIAGIGTSISGIAIYQGNHTIMLTIAAGCTIVGPALCNLTTEE